jgi:hypothetical protein
VKEGKKMIKAAEETRKAKGGINSFTKGVLTKRT